MRYQCTSETQYTFNSYRTASENQFQRRESRFNGHILGFRGGGLGSTNGGKQNMFPFLQVRLMPKYLKAKKFIYSIKIPEMFHSLHSLLICKQINFWYNKAKETWCIIEIYIESINTHTSLKKHVPLWRSY